MSTVLKNVIRPDDIDRIEKFLAAKEFSETVWLQDDEKYLYERGFGEVRFAGAQQQLFYKNKQLDYEDRSPVHEVVAPLMERHFGSCEFSSGSYFESFFPYPLHIDTDKVPNVKKRHEVVALIPLSEGPEQRTVIFDCPVDEVVPGVTERFVTDRHNGLKLEDFLHVNERDRRNLSYLPLETDFEWKLGDMLILPRGKIHLSTDFRGSCPFKRSVNILFF